MKKMYILSNAVHSQTNICYHAYSYGDGTIIQNKQISACRLPYTVV